MRFNRLAGMWWAILVLGLFTAGCGVSAPVSAPEPVVSGEPAEAAVGGSAKLVKPEVSQIPAAGADLEPDGRYFGFIRSIQEGEFSFDVAEFLSGEDGLRAAIEDGEAVDGVLPNDVYLRNRSPAVRSVRLAPNVLFTLIRCIEECESVPVGLEELRSLLAGESNGFYGHPESLFDVTLLGGEAALVQEQYLP
ncbi:MAG: hypothetical protein ACT4OM_03385 [Actinomycetota bacterium]